MYVEDEIFYIDTSFNLFQQCCFLYVQDSLLAEEEGKLLLAEVRLKNRDIREIPETIF